MGLFGIFSVLFSVVSVSFRSFSVLFGPFRSFLVFIAAVHHMLEKLHLFFDFLLFFGSQFQDFLEFHIFGYFPMSMYWKYDVNLT